MNTAHKHAHNMALYAQDALETETPWERWEMAFADSLPWHGMDSHPGWIKHYEYRRKPQTIRIGDIDVPKPMSTAPVIGSVYWLVCFESDNFACALVWRDDKEDRLRLERRLCHATEEATTANAKALIAVSGGTFEEGSDG